MKGTLPMINPISSSDLINVSSLKKDLSYSQIIDKILRLAHQIFQNNTKEISGSIQQEKRRYLDSTHHIATLHGRNSYIPIATSIASFALKNVGKMFPILSSFEEVFGKAAEGIGVLVKSNNETKLHQKTGIKDLSLQELSGMTQEKSSQETDTKQLSQLMEALNQNYRAATSR